MLTLIGSPLKGKVLKTLCQLEKCILYMFNEALEFILIALHQKQNALVFGEIVQSVKHLSCKREALSSIPGGDVMHLKS